MSGRPTGACLGVEELGEHPWRREEQRSSRKGGWPLLGAPEQALVTLPGAAMPTTAATGACRSWAASPNWSGTFSRPARATSSAVSDAPNAREGAGVRQEAPPDGDPGAGPCAGGMGSSPSQNRERHVHPHLLRLVPNLESPVIPRALPWPQALPPPRGLPVPGAGRGAKGQS